MSLETVIFHPKEMLGISDLLSIGYYKNKHNVLQQNLSKYFRFEPENALFDQFSKCVNILRKEK